MEFLLIILSLVLGASFGSFLNVVIHRLPLKQSIVFPASHCPECGNNIRPYDNIPILSYFILQGKCRHCRTDISIRYLFVEFLTAVCFLVLLILNDYVLDFTLLRNIIFFTTGIAIIFIDFKHYIIPDVISLPLIALGIGFSFITTEPGWQSSLVAASAGFGIFFLIAWLYIKLKNQVGLGGGDVKYMAAIGAFVGISGALFVLFFSSVIALGSYLISTYIGGNKEALSSDTEPKILPYGPFLALATFFYILFGDKVIGSYLGLFTSVL